MKLVSKENLTESRIKLTVEVSAEEFDLYLDQAFNKVVKEVKVDGFRPGKMPKSMFISRFGYEALYEEAVNFALNDSYSKAVAEANVNPISDPQLADLSEPEKGKGLTYSVSFDVWPTAHLGEYKGVTVKALSTEVTEEVLNERVNAVLKQKAENVVKEGAVENGDTVVIDFEGFKDGVAFAGGKAENYELEIGSGSFIPGFEDQLVGMVTGETKDINVTFPTEYHAEDLAGQPVVFKIVLHEVKTKVVPELTDELVEELEIENVHTKEEYLAYMTDVIAKQLTQQAEHHLEESLINAVIDSAKADLPESVVEKEVEEGVKRLEAQAKQYGLPADMLLKYQGIESMDQYKEMYKTYVSKDIMKELCFAEIAKVENIEVTPEELEAEYKVIANVTEADDEKAAEKKIKEAKKQTPIYNVANHILNRKVFTFIKENAVIEK